MSVASLNNGSLQLAELIISNEKYSNAAGFISSSSSFTAGLTGTQLTLGADPSSVNLLCNGPGSLIVEGTITTLGNATFESGTLILGEQGVTGPVSLLCSAPGTLFVGGNVRGAMSKVNTSASLLALAAGANIPVQATLPNFVGNGTTSAYVVSSNFGAALGVVLNVSFVSTASGSTIVEIDILNITAGPITATLPLSVIGMN